MSLAIPYLLDAAAETGPDEVITILEERITVGTFNDRTQAGADRFLADGLRPGDSIRLPSFDSLASIIDSLAAARVGLVLSDMDPTTHARTNRPLPTDRYVSESLLWSESAFASIGGDMITHGRVIRAARQDARTLPSELGPLLHAIRAVEQSVIGTGGGSDTIPVDQLGR
ncbi:hypothetical protein [Microbacterium sp. MPKO10]|uniref:hypothetical protein n=1 Tax=Microbacterium sp. MPKO10 TaxID=2989818 RepID=UPI0022368075|nr:hypothetical protein [Microbacterium sp. MPKO10]MCW4459623.1 hypothetical protein [Microbacterium sp. MPKO10]